MRVIRCAVPFALVLLMVCPPPALAWGKAGRRVIATLPTSLLASEAQRQVTNLRPVDEFTELSRCSRIS